MDKIANKLKVIEHANKNHKILDFKWPNFGPSMFGGSPDTLLYNPWFCMFQQTVSPPSFFFSSILVNCKCVQSFFCASKCLLCLSIWFCYLLFEEIPTFYYNVNRFFASQTRAYCILHALNHKHEGYFSDFLFFISFFFCHFLLEWFEHIKSRDRII